MHNLKVILPDIKTLRDCVSQAELARLSGLRQQAISRIEKPGYIPRLSTLIKIAQAMGMQVKVTFEKK